MLRLSKFFGSFPFKLKFGVLTVSCAWLAYSLLLICLLECLEIRNVYLGLGKTHSKRSKQKDLVKKAHFLYRCFLYPFCFMNIILRRNEVSLFMQTISKVDSVLTRISIEKDKPNNILGSCLLVNCMCSVVMDQYLKFDVLAALKVGVFHFFLVGCVLQFNTFVLEIVGCLTALNRALQDFGERHRNSELGPKLLLMSDVHYLLTTASRQLDDGYRRTYFTLVCGVVWTLVSTGYQVAVLIFVDYTFVGPVRMWLWAALGLLWWCFWLIFVHATVQPCSAALMESVKFNLQLSHLLTHADSWGFKFHNLQHKVCNYISMVPVVQKLLNLHSRYNFIVKFSCGFFDLNNSLIQSVLGGVVTFVVILLQTA